jgi:hypothetical protein
MFQMLQVCDRAGAKVVHTQHIMPLCEQLVTEMGTEETGSAGYEQLLSLHEKTLSSKTLFVLSGPPSGGPPESLWENKLNWNSLATLSETTEEA